MKFKFLLSIVVIVVIYYVLVLLVKDWRTAIIAGLIGGTLYKERLKSFLAGLIGSFIAWFALMAPILFNEANQKLLSIFSSIADFPLEIILALIFLLPTILGGLSSLIASTIRKILEK